MNDNLEREITEALMADLPDSVKIDMGINVFIGILDDEEKLKLQWLLDKVDPVEVHAYWESVL